MTRSILVVSLLLSPACALEDPDLGTTESSLTDADQLPDLSIVTATPPGYGNYCSVVDPPNGGWAFTWGAAGSAPCASLAKIVGPTTVVRRAGLYAIDGNNNAMATCDGYVALARDTGANALNDIFNSAAGHTHCTFTIAPTRLPIFGMPYRGKVTYTTAFDYHWDSGWRSTPAPWNIVDFGRIGDGQASHVDRTGWEAGSYLTPTPPWQPYKPLHPGGGEGAYDWSMAKDSELLAVADGVLHVQYRDTPGCQSSPQLEMFLETEVGKGEYAEHFIAAYHHMDPLPSPSDPLAYARWLSNKAQWNPATRVPPSGFSYWALPPDGTVVHKGDVIGYVGNSGCSTGSHLDFSVARLTNITGARAYKFQMTPKTATGVNGSQGVIDPFGWDAPAGVDPGAYKNIGFVGPDQPANIPDSGAFSIDLWQMAFLAAPPANGGEGY